MAAFGIEEEYLLLDAASGRPKPSLSLLQDLTSDSSESSAGLKGELLSCQLESSTPVCHTLSEAESSLTAFRRRLGAAADRAGILAAGVGIAPDHARGPAEVSDDARYRRIAENAPAIVADQYVTGLHVHVEVADRETRIGVLNRLRPWLPTLVALGGNSAFWLGSDSGFASWRNILYRRWAIQGCPPHVRDAADYDRRVAALLATEAAFDYGHIAWLARLSSHYPTVEIRAADSQLTVADAVLFAALARALVRTELRSAEQDSPYAIPAHEYLDTALWQAARHGISDELLDVARGILVPAHEALQTLLIHVSDALEETGDTERVTEGLKRLSLEGNGAARQRAAMAGGGLPALLHLLRASLTR